MINQPDTGDLLTEARQVLLDSLVPELSGAHRYQALMIANALGMAIRELEQRGESQPEACDQALSLFLAAKGLPDDLVAGEQTLARALRERRLDGADDGLRSVLRGLTEARLRINNPGHLKRAGGTSNHD